MVHHPIVSRLPDEHPYQPQADCPGWCAFHSHGVCQSADQVHDGIRLHLLRTQHMTVSDVWINGIPWVPLQALDLGRVFSQLGHAELAAAVTRLAEYAIADRVTA